MHFASEPGPASPSGSSSSSQSPISLTRQTQRAASTSALSSSLVSSATQTMSQLPARAQAVPLDKASQDATNMSQQEAGMCHSYNDSLCMYNESDSDHCYHSAESAFQLMTS